MSAIYEVPARSAGALDGFGWTCPECAMEIVYSLESLVASEARVHLEWHQRRWARAERSHEGRVS